MTQNKMKKRISTLFFVFVSVILTLMLVNATQSFTVSPLTLTDTVTVGSSSSKTFTIENTGDELINLTFGNTVVSKAGASDVTVTLNKTSVTNLAVGATLTVKATYAPNSNQAVGTYLGSILVANTDNSSQDEVISLTVTLQSDSSNEYDIEFEGEGSTISMEIDVDDDSETATFKLKNIGNQRIDDIELDLDSRLDGKDDEINDDDIEINGNDGSDTYKFDEEETSDFHLMPNESTNVKIRIDIPSNLDVDDYKGSLEVSYKLANGTTTKRTFTLKVIATSNSDDVFFDDNLYVRNGIFEVTGEAGDTIDDIELLIANDASYNIEGVTLKLDGNLEEEDSSAYISKDAVTFSGLPLDIDDRSDETVDVEIEIPDNQATGTYIAKIELYNAQDKKKDTITLRVKVTGEVYFKEIKFDNNIDPGQNLDVEFTIKNQGSKSLNSVQVYATLFDIDYGFGDITVSTNTFILNAGDEKTQTLRFNIPDEASDGSHTLQMRVTYSGGEITETEELIVNRPSNNVIVSSFGINPQVAKCQNDVYTFIKFKNLGKYDENVQVTSEVQGTNIKGTSSNYKLIVDGENTESINLDIRTLEAGEYKVVQKINAGGKVTTKESTLQVLECSDTSIGGIDIKDLNNNTETDGNATGPKTITLFGQEIETTTAWLGGGVGVSFLAIIVVAIFLL